MTAGPEAAPARSLGALFALDGRRALVTGASRGIGRAIAGLLAAAGADVVVHYHRSADRAAEVTRAIEELGRRAQAIAVDLSRPGAGAALAERASEALGGIDILVLNAAEQRRAPLAAVRPDDYELQITTGFGAAVELVRTLLPPMRARGFGRVIAIGSVQQLRPNPELAIYGAMKSALAHLMRNFAKPAAADGVTLNTIQPGLIDTDRNEVLKADAASYAELIRRIPANRAGHVDEVAALALYLAGPLGGYASGAELLLDGGLALP